MLSPPQPLNEILLNFVCELLTWMGGATAHFWTRPLRVVKRSNIIKFQLQRQFQRFLYQTLCVLTNERYKTYQIGFLFSHLVHALGVGLGGARGSKSKFDPSVYYAISSSTIGRNPTKSYVWFAHINGACNSTYFGPAPWGGVERPYIIKLQLQRFLYQTFCEFSQI